MLGCSAVAAECLGACENALTSLANKELPCNGLGSW